PAALRPRRLTREQRTTVILAAMTALLGLGALGAESARNRHELNRVESEIRRIDPEVRAVQRAMDDLEHQRRLLATAQTVAAASLRPLPLLRELTETLPTDVWLTTLTLDAKGVELTGQASTASALIPLLENSPSLEHAEFASPVTRGRDREQFRIRAGWERQPTAAPAPPPPRPTPARAVRPGPPAIGTPGEPARPRRDGSAGRRAEDASLDGGRAAGRRVGAGEDREGRGRPGRPRGAKRADPDPDRPGGVARNSARNHGFRWYS